MSGGHRCPQSQQPELRSWGKTGWRGSLAGVQTEDRAVVALGREVLPETEEHLGAVFIPELSSSGCGWKLGIDRVMPFW